MSTDSHAPVLVWFRDDHRLSDNPALSAAAATGSQVLCFYVLDEVSERIRPLGGAARWWLHGSLKALGEALERVGSRLLILRGSALPIVDKLVRETGACAIYWNRRYGATEIALDSMIKKSLTDRGIKAHSFNGRLLHEPWEIVNQAGKPFQVFTPYLRAVRAQTIKAPLPAPRSLQGGIWPATLLDEAVSLPELDLEPSSPDWTGGLRREWQR